MWKEISLFPIAHTWAHDRSMLLQEPEAYRLYCFEPRRSNIVGHFYYHMPILSTSQSKVLVKRLQSCSVSFD